MRAVQSVHQYRDVFAGVCRCERDAQACLAAGDGWVPDGGYENSLFVQRGGKLHGLLLTANHDGNDGGGNFRCPIFDGRKKFADPRPN